jgi:hypothetical protein
MPSATEAEAKDAADMGEALDKAAEPHPATHCVVCSRLREHCTTIADASCLAVTNEDTTLTIIRLATEVVQWADTAHQMFDALEGAYTGKINCGWCKIVIEPGRAMAHVEVCTKNPLAVRLRELIANVEAVNSRVGDELNIGDITYALDNILEKAKRPLEGG